MTTTKTLSFQVPQINIIFQANKVFLNQYIKFWEINKNFAVYA